MKKISSWNVLYSFALQNFFENLVIEFSFLYNYAMNLENICVILDHPDEPRNIGSACRAMANNDIKKLRIVGKKSDYDAEKISVLAIHAFYIYENAEFFNSITEAAEDCVLSFGTTRRRGKYRKGKLFLPEEFASLADEISGSKENPGGKVALVFGNERTGLTDSELSECTDAVTIPSSIEFGSLNLSHAVQIMCYHLFRKNNSFLKGYTPVSLKRLDETVSVISENLKKIGFFKVAGQNDMEKFWKSILSRAALSEGEVQYIEKVFTKAAGLSSKKN